MSTLIDKMIQTLIKSQNLKEEDIQSAISLQKRKGTTLSKALVDMGLIEERDLLMLLVRELNIPFINLSKYKIDPSLQEIVPEKVARQYKIIPLSAMDFTMTVAMADPMNVVVIDDLKNITGKEIEIVMSTASDIDKAIDRYYGQSGVATVTDITKDIQVGEFEIVQDGLTEGSDDVSADEGEKAPIIRMTNLIIKEAIRQRASDIHMEPMVDGRSEGRWRAEASTTRDEILFFANDESQSRGRAYAAIQTSIELDPMFDRQKRILYDATGAPKWRIIEDFLEHIPTGTKVKAVNVDYRGEAGSNPSLTIWTEAWGFDTDKQFKLFDEMTPVLTRFHSQRYVESYAGYTGKSKILEHMWNLATRTDQGGRRLTIDDIPDWPWPDEHELPLYVNEMAGLFAYIDQGPIARTRMPWTQGPEADKYYAEQAHTLTPEQYDRLHLNQWVSPTSAFLPVEWWLACKGELSVMDNRTPIVLAVDASVSGDCTAIVGVSRHPVNYQDLAVRFAYKWDPPKGGKLDYETTPNSVTEESVKDTLIRLCKEYNVVEIAYDEWQLHHLMNELRNSGIAWCKPFSQSTQRDIADKQLYDLIKTRRITHDGYLGGFASDMEQHIKNAARKQRIGEDTKLHIIKSAENAKIDLVIALSMASSECLRLDL